MMLYTVQETSQRVIQIKTVSLFQGDAQNDDQILTLYIILYILLLQNKYFTGTTQIESQKSNGMAEESIENVTKSDSNFVPIFADHHLLPDTNFNGD